MESAVQERMSEPTSPVFDVGARLRALRHERGLSQRKLAELAAVPPSQIAAIEKNLSSPTVASLRKIITGLSITMAEFFTDDEQAQGSDSPVYRKDDMLDLTAKIMTSIGAKWKGMSLRQVGDARKHNLQILIETYAPGADTGPTLMEHEASEGGVVISGELEITIGNDRYLLHSGDAFLFDSRNPHRFRNISNEEAVVITALTPP